MIRRSCIVFCNNQRQRRRQPFSGKSHSSAIEQVAGANKNSESALSKLNNLATQATQLAKTKANYAVTNASKTIRTSLHNAKANAKLKSEQYAWEAHLYIKNKADHTKEQIKQSIEEATLSTKDRMKKEMSKRIPQFKMPMTLSGGKTSGSLQAPIKSAPIAAQSSESTTLQSAKPHTNSINTKIAFQTSLLSSSLSSLLPTKDSISSSAPTSAISKATTETISRTTSNLSSQFQSTIHKAFKWLWWGGLAAVGVYGITTTLTKEGVALLKDLVGGSSSSDDGKSSSSNNKVKNGGRSAKEAEVVLETDHLHDGFEAVAVEDTINCDDEEHANVNHRSSSWVSSWRRS